MAAARNLDQIGGFAVQQAHDRRRIPGVTPPFWESPEFSLTPTPKPGLTRARTARPGDGVGRDCRSGSSLPRLPTFTLREIADVEIGTGGHIVCCTDALSLRAKKRDAVTALIAEAEDRKRRIEALIAALEASGRGMTKTIL